MDAGELALCRIRGTFMLQSNLSHPIYWILVMLTTVKEVGGSCQVRRSVPGIAKFENSADQQGFGSPIFTAESTASISPKGTSGRGCLIDDNPVGIDQLASTRAQLRQHFWRRTLRPTEWCPARLEDSCTRRWA